MRPILLSTLTFIGCFAIILALRPAPLTKATASILPTNPILEFPSHKSKATRFAVVINEKTGYIDSTGKLAIPAIYNSGGEFAEGLAPVRLNGHYGYINEKGDRIIQPRFEWAGPFSAGMAVVTEKGMPHYIDRNGHSPFPCNFASLGPFNYNTAPIQTITGKYGLIDRKGKLLIDTFFDRLSDFYSGVAVLQHNGKYNDTAAIIDTAGNYIVRPGRFQDIHEFSGGYAIAYRDGRNSIIDPGGNIIFTRPEHDTVFFYGDEFHDGLAVVILNKPRARQNKNSTSSKDDFEGYLNLQNQIVLRDTTVKTALPFSNGRAFLEHENWRYTLINTRMQPVGETAYSWIDKKGFVNGHALVTTADGLGIIDTNAHFTPIPHSISADKSTIIGDYLFAANEHNGLTHYQIFSMAGTPIGKPNIEAFDQAGFQNGILRATVDSSLTFINTSGAIIWQAPKARSLTNLNIDYLIRGYFYARDPKLGSPPKIPGMSLILAIDTTRPDIFANSYNAYTVYLANNNIVPFVFNSQDNRLYMRIQALNAEGKWQYIDYLPSSWCGNSYYTIDLAPRSYWKFTLPRFEGEMQTKLRIEVFYKGFQYDQPLYSNTINTSINPGQFSVKRYNYRSHNFMDPYTD